MTPRTSFDIRTNSGNENAGNDLITEDDSREQSGFANPLVDYTNEELAVIAELLDVLSFPGVDITLDSLTAEAREEALTSGSRSLVARHVLEILDGDGLVITPPHAVLFNTVLEPVLVIAAQHEFESEAATRTIYATMDLAVEQWSAVEGVHTHFLFDPTELVERVSELVALDPAGSTTGMACELTLGELVALESAVAEGVVPPEVAPRGADDFAHALAAPHSTSSVSCQWRDGESIVGGELTWIHAGDAGSWIVDPVEAPDTDPRPDSTKLSIRPVSKDDIVAELLSYLPAEFTNLNRAANEPSE